jgi:hypothetical protein
MMVILASVVYYKRPFFQQLELLLDGPVKPDHDEKGYNITSIPICN